MGLARPVITIGDYEIFTLSNGTYRENCYLVVRRATDESIIIDPGGESTFLIERIDTCGVRPQKILLTHGHFDHLGAVDALMDRYQIVCEVHALERRLVRQAATYAFRFDREVPVRVPRNLTYFENVSDLEWGDRAIAVLPTPGHTSGSVALAIGSAFVFTGDTLLRERIGPTTYPESDPASIPRSVTLLLRDLPDECVVFPGHGRPWTIGAAREWWGGLSGEIPKQEIF